MEEIAVVINAGAGEGHGRELAAKLQAGFARAGLHPQITVAKDGAAIADDVRAALGRGAGTIVGGGGDGTLSQVASAILDCEHPVRFGILPLGTLNHFAKDLGIPLELDAAIAVVAGGRVAEIDTAEVNGRLFLNNSSIGLYPDIVHDRERQQSRLGRGKWPAFAWATLGALRRFPFHTVTLCVDGQEHVRRTAFVFVGNNDYDMKGMDIGARSRLDRGQLSVYVSRHSGRAGLLLFALAALFGMLDRLRGLDHLLTDRLRIEARRPRLRVATDGEVNEMEAPLEYRSRPKSLQVLVPDPAKEEPE